MYYRGKDNCFPINSRVMTSAITESIVQKDFPERASGLLEITPHTFKTMVDFVDVPDKPCLMLVRHPLDKVKSALAFIGIEDYVKVVIDGLKNDKDFMNRDHFRRQSDYVQDVANAGQTLQCFAYPDQVPLFQVAAGFTTPFINLNESTGEKPELTEEQEEFFLEYYASDLELYNSLSS